MSPVQLSLLGHLILPKRVSYDMKRDCTVGVYTAQLSAKLSLGFQMFVRHYDTIMENFVRDDQEDDTTFVNLTVQFFTVKSIAHLLMTETDVFSKLVNMFRRRLIGHLGEPVKMRNGVKKLEQVTMQLCYTFLCYLLSCSRPVSGRSQPEPFHPDGGREGGILALSRRPHGPHVPAQGACRARQV